MSVTVAEGGRWDLVEVPSMEGEPSDCDKLFVCVGVVDADEVDVRVPDAVDVRVLVSSSVGVACVALMVLDTAVVNEADGDSFVIATVTVASRVDVGVRVASMLADPVGMGDCDRVAVGVGGGVIVLELEILVLSGSLDDIVVVGVAAIVRVLVATTD